MARLHRTPSSEAPMVTADQPVPSAEDRYPVNEVMLKTLVCSGKSGKEIATLCSTTPSTVAHMREAYGV